MGVLSAGLASYDFSDCDHPAQRGPTAIFVMHLIIGRCHNWTIIISDKHLTFGSPMSFLELNLYSLFS
jgi:hypothetical protein